MLLWLHLYKATERRRREKGNSNILNVRPEKRTVKGLRFGFDFGRAINTSIFPSFPVGERITYVSEDPCSPNGPSPITVSTNTICVYWGHGFANKWVICQRFLLVSNVDNGLMRLKKRSMLNFCCLTLNIYQSYFDWIVLQNLNSFSIYGFINSIVSQLLCCSHLSKWHNNSPLSWCWNSRGQDSLYPFPLGSHRHSLSSAPCYPSSPSHDHLSSGQYHHLLEYLLPMCSPAHNIASTQQPLLL